MQKNVLYLKSVDNTWLDIADRLKDLHDWKPVLWVGITKLDPSMLSRLNGAKFYAHADARRGLPPEELPGLPVSAVDADILQKLSPYEPEIYEMMSRFTLGVDSLSYDERRRFYYNLIQIWITILKELNIDIVICGSVPHRVYDYLVYLLCQEMGITYLMIEQAGLPHLSYGISSTTDRSRTIRETFHEIGNDFSLNPLTEEYINRIRGKYEDAMPSYFKEKIVKGQNKSMARKLYDSLPFGARFFASFIKGAMQGRLSQDTGLMHFKASTRFSSDIPDYASHFQALRLHYKVNIKVSRAERWYNKHAVKPDLTKPYIYFAAHVQPERSTCPDAGIYHDQSLILRLLSKALPDGWKIYYKEHPTMFRFPYSIDNARDTRYYERIQRIPNCIFIDSKTDQFELIDNSIATASARGTCAWEGVLRGVPAITFADCWYSSCPGIFKVRTLNECKDAMKTLRGGFKPDQNKIRKYLAAAEQCCEDLSFRRSKDACVSDIAKNDPLEYERRVKLLAKVLTDEYYRSQGRSDQKAKG